MLTAKLKGRTGNQFFQIASSIGLAVKLGYKFGFDFNEPHFINALPKPEGELKPLKVPWGYHNLTLPDGLELDGYMQSEKYFKHCAGLIRHYFKFDFPEVTTPDNAVAVHIRLGDYKKSSVHPVCSMDYYYRAAKQMPEESKYYIFSDSPGEARKLFPNFELIYNDPIKDLYLMTQFKRHIIANSSFSWWGAWLAQSKQVIAPLKWFSNDLETKDIYPEGWIVI